MVQLQNRIFEKNMKKKIISFTERTKNSLKF